MPYAKPNKKQDVLFGEQEEWREEWQGMPEFSQENLLPEYSVRVNFVTYEDLQKFASLVEQVISTKTPSIWFPKQEKENLSNKRYVE
jgi:hypothetical protein